MSISAFIDTAHSQPRFVLGSGKEIDNPQCLLFQKIVKKKIHVFLCEWSVRTCCQAKETDLCYRTSTWHSLCVSVEAFFTQAKIIMWSFRPYRAREIYAVDMLVNQKRIEKENIFPCIRAGILRRNFMNYIVCCLAQYETLWWNVTI